jgi:uncharacterized protein (DUF1501 family)
MLDPDISAADSLRLLSNEADPTDDVVGPNGWTRRRFLQAVGYGVAGGATLGTVGPSFAELLGVDPGEAFAASPIGATDGVLVNIVLYGGNDGLNTVVPYTDPLYYDRRGGVAIAAGNVLALDGKWGLNSNLPYIKSLWDEGSVAIVHGVGYPNPDLSHFTSMGIWMHGNLRGGTPTSGFIGRWHDQVAADRAEMAVATIGSSVPLHLQGFNRRALGIPHYGDLFGARVEASDRRLYDAVSAFSATGAGRGQWHDTYANVLRTQIGVAGEVAPVFNPEVTGSDFVRKMTIAARLINANLGFRILDVGHDGFDNHDGQPSDHAPLLAELDAGLRAFYATLAPAWHRNVTLMTMSEFGRTVHANDSSGTDHGTANVQFVIGANVNGRRHLGDPPSLDLPDRWDRLPHTVDFRAVFGSVLDGWLGAGSSSVLNGTFEDLGLFSRKPGEAPPPPPPPPDRVPGGGTLPPAPTSPPSGLVPMAPVRIMDSRDGMGGVKTGAMVAGEMAKVRITGAHGIPAGATAVVANVTSVGATEFGFMTVFPGGTKKPDTSNLNTAPGRPVPNLVVIGIGGDGCVDIYNAIGGSHCLVDVFGYFADGAGDRFTPLVPKRLFDTRLGQGIRRGKIATGDAVEVQVAGLAGVPPSGATAVVLNLGVTETDSPGWMRLRPAGDALVNDTSNLNFFAGDVVPNLAVCKLSSEGTVIVDGVGSGAHVFGDVFGYFGGTGTSQLRTIAPARLLDTRIGQGAPAGPVSGSSSARLVVAGQGSIPAEATAVVLNVTATNVRGGTFVTVWPDGEGQPDTSNLNAARDQTIANLVICRLGSGGAVRLASPPAPCDLLADVLGYFVG